MIAGSNQKKKRANRARHDKSVVNSLNVSSLSNGHDDQLYAGLNSSIHLAMDRAEQNRSQVTKTAHDADDIRITIQSNTEQTPIANDSQSPTGRSRI